MARQTGAYRFIGTVDDLCFYKMNGRYYVRRKSSLTEKQFWKSKAFEGARKSCSRFAEGNKLASEVYQLIEEGKRVYSLFCFLKRRAILLLKEGKCLKEAEKVLVDYLIDLGIIERERKKVKNGVRKSLISPKADLVSLLKRDRLDGGYSNSYTPLSPTGANNNYSAEEKNIAITVS